MLPFLELLDTGGEKEQLLLLYKCFRDALYEVAYFKLKDVDKAEDMVQDTFMTMTKNLHNIDNDAYRFLEQYMEEKEKDKSITINAYSKKIGSRAYSKAWYYLVTIINNKIYDLYRQKDNSQMVYVDEYYDQIIISEKENPIEIVQKEEIKILLTEIINNMQSPYKEAIYLKYFGKLSNKEIGNILNKSQVNVRKILERGRNAIKLKLQEGGYDDIR